MLDRLYNESSKSRQRQDYFLIYTLLFILMAVIAFAAFWFNGKSFIWREDGINQHYNALVYLGQWGREILSNLFENHTLQVPLWDYNIGYGSDILTTLNYYVIGDPLDLLSILVDSEHTEYLYCFLIILRLYLAGLAFSAFCFTLKQRRMAVLAGSFCYIFCGYALYAAVRHPYFSNPMIYLPLLLIGVERILNKEKSRPVLFTFMVFLSAISNFYFFYILVIAVVVYVIFRFFMLDHVHPGREFLFTILKFLGFGIVGVMMAAFLLYPVCLLLLGTSRANVAVLYDPLYHWTYYEKFIASFTTSTEADFWAKTAFPAPALLAILALFSEKGKKWVYKIMFIGTTILFLFPVFGSFLNGFSYVTNRWCFVYGMLVAFLLVKEWDQLIHPKKRAVKWMLAGTGIYYVLLLLIDQGVSETTYVSVTIILFSLMLILLLRPRMKVAKLQFRTRQIISWGLMVLILFNIGMNSYYEYAYKEDHYVSEFIDAGTLYDKVTTTGTAAAKEVDEYLEDTDNYGRVEEVYSDTYPILNTAALNDIGSTQFYWSLAKGTITEYLQEMSVSGSKWSYDYRNLDKRTMLTELAGVKYFVTQDEEIAAPYGYTLVEEVVANEEQMKEIRKEYRKELGVKKLTKDQYDMIQDKYADIYYVYANEYALPLGYTYDSYLTEDQFETMEATDREEALMQGVLLTDDGIATLQNSGADVDQTSPLLTSHSLDYTLTPGDGVTLNEDGTFFVSAAKSSITLEFTGRKDCEYYLWVEGVDAQYMSQLDLYQDDNLDVLPETMYDQLTRFQKNIIRYKDSKTSDWSQNQYKFKVSMAGGDSTSFTYSSPYYKWNSGQKDFLVNLGYYDSAKKKITIKFPYAGTYSFDDLEVICQPMSLYSYEVENLKENTLENIEMGTNSLKGTITLDSDKILCLTVPYDEGWTAYVDGEKTDILQANTMYMGLALSAGEHTIELKYQTVGLKEGAVVSLAGLVIFLVIVGATVGKNRRRSGRVAPRS